MSPRSFKRLLLTIQLAALTGAAAELRTVPGLVTTTPVTQNRDKAIYDWETRHGEILKRNAAFKPDVVVFGDSIIHYWAGEPRAPLVWGADAWARCFEGIQVTNLGFGWDRTENVLWRIEHGELDGIDPKAVVIHIGTNNTAVDHSPEDIASGIEAVCVRIHERLPKARILLLGILTRKDEKPLRPSITEKVNQLLSRHVAGIEWISYRDFGAHFRNADTTPNAKLFADGVHVNADGYAVLGEHIRRELLPLIR
jgi:lysophospholipase L1-like esterase